MKKIFFTLALVAFSQLLWAQGAARSKKSFGRTTQELGLTLSTSGNLSAAAFNLTQFWGLGAKKQRFKIGLGARLTSSYGVRGLEYITAPAELTSGKTGPSVFFADQVVENIDTMGLNNTQVNALNLVLALRYDFSRRCGFEFNIDLAGISFGATKRANIQYDDNKFLNSNARPTVGNALLISDNDRGSLNSELMFNYWFRKYAKLKVGGVFLFNEYDLDQPVAYFNNSGKFIENTRYRHKSLQFGVGVNFVIQNRQNTNIQKN